MMKLYQALRRAMLVSPLVLFCFLSLALAEKRTLDSTRDTPAYISDRSIALRLTTYDNRVITVSQYDGEMITTGPKEQEMLGIIPRIHDDSSVTLEFFRVVKIIRKNTIVGDAVTGVGSMELKTTLPQSTSISLISTIELISVSGLAEVSKVRPYNNQPCPCCVTCDGWEVCAVSVQMWCGSCSCR